MLTCTVFIATIIMAITMGTKHGIHTGWSFMAGGLVATGLTYKLEEFTDALLRKLKR